MIMNSLSKTKICQFKYSHAQSVHIKRGAFQVTQTAHAAETIRQLVFENDNLRQEQRKVVSELTARIHQLEDQNINLSNENVSNR
jgi:hypothetical protein